METTTRLQTTCPSSATAKVVDELWWPPLLLQEKNDDVNNNKNDTPYATAVRINLMDYMKQGRSKVASSDNSKLQQYIFDTTDYPDSSYETQRKLVSQIQALCAEQGVVVPIKVHSWAHKESRGTLRIRLRCPFRKSAVKCPFGFQVCFDINKRYWYIHRGCGNFIHNHGHAAPNDAIIHHPQKSTQGHVSIQDKNTAVSTIATTTSTICRPTKTNQRKRRLSPPSCASRSPEMMMKTCDPQQNHPLYYSSPYFGYNVFGSQDYAFPTIEKASNSHVLPCPLTPSPPPPSILSFATGSMYKDDCAIVGTAVVASKKDDNETTSTCCHGGTAGGASSLQRMLQDCLQTDFPQDYYSTIKPPQQASIQLPCCCPYEDAIDNLLYACCNDLVDERVVNNDDADSSLSIPTKVVAVGKGVYPLQPPLSSFYSAATSMAASAHSDQTSSSSGHCVDILFQYIQLICEREAFAVMRNVGNDDDGVTATIPPINVYHSHKDDDSAVTMKLLLHCTRQSTCCYQIVVTWVVHETHWEISCERDGAFVHSCDRLAFSASADEVANSCTAQRLCGFSTDSLLDQCEEKSPGRTIEDSTQAMEVKGETSMPCGSGAISQPPQQLINSNCPSSTSSYFEALVFDSLKEILNGDILCPFAVDSSMTTTASSTDDCLASGDQPAPAA